MKQDRKSLVVVLWWFLGLAILCWLLAKHFMSPRANTVTHDMRVKYRRALEANNIPIRFFGKVVDQDGRPLVGVNVHIETRVLIEAAPTVLGAEFHKYNLVSDADGLFVLSNARGDTMTVDSIEKEGYELSHNAKMGFLYNRPPTDPSLFIPDPARPALFKMWKKRGAEPIAHHQLSRQGIPCDGTPLTFDLLTGKKDGKQSDIRVSFWRNPLHIVQDKQKYDWKLVIESTDGGLIRSDDEFMYVAPEDGYQPKIEIAMAATNSNWVIKENASFYLKSRGGKHYARINLQLTTNYEPPPTGLTIESWLNPNGSRNLEFDRSKRAGSGNEYQLN